jgi:hypothetical protein
MTDEDEGRLTRWSRRKRQEQQGRRGGAAPAAVASVDPAFTPAPGEAGLPAAVPVDDAGEAEAVDEEAVKDLPPVDSLDKDSDYTPFLNAGVPGKLARAALRKLWSSDPAFNIRDGLDDYDEDFTIIEAMKGALEDKLGDGKDKVAKADEADAAEEGVEEVEDVEDVEEDMDEAEDVGEGEDDDLAAAGAEDDMTETDDDEPGPETPPGKSKNKQV